MGSKQGGICMECERFIEEPSCWHHPEVHLFDPTEPTTVDSLRDMDDRHRERAYSRTLRKYGLIAAAIAVPWLIVIAAFGPQPATLFPLALLAPLAGLGPKWVRRKAAEQYRPRFGRWTGEEGCPELTEEELAAIEPYDEEESDPLSFLG